MIWIRTWAAPIFFLLLLVGCKTSRHHSSSPAEMPQSTQYQAFPRFVPTPEMEKRILALDPEAVTEQDVREVLLGAPAPRIINIHGGLLPIQGSMTSFSEFLIGMGYPRASLQNPRDGSYALGFYVNSEHISGMLAWYYEHEGLRPFLVGHSQGGIQVIKVLHRLVAQSESIAVWNPLTEQAEQRCEFTDPLTGQRRSVVGLRIPYATVVVAGGLGRFLPNQWEMNGKLRDIPDSVEEFTGFQKGMDVLGGDFLGFGSANNYVSSGTAVVHNVRLPASEAHSTLPRTRHLLKSEQIRRWINNYRPPTVTDQREPERIDLKFDSNSSHILWAANVWFYVKKHWVLELQQWLRAAGSHA